MTGVMGTLTPQECEPAAVPAVRVVRTPVDRLFPGAVAGPGVRLPSGRSVVFGTPMSAAFVRAVRASGLRDVPVVDSGSRELFMTAPTDAVRAEVLRGLMRAAQGPRPLACRARERGDGEKAARAMDRALATASWYAPVSRLIAAEAFYGPYLPRVLDEGLLACIVGAGLGWGQDALYELALAAVCSDLGTLLLPSRLLGKPGPLSRRERRLMQVHPRLAAGVLAPLRQLLPGLLQITMTRHERADGSGWPAGAGEDEIPEGAFLIALAQRYGSAMRGRPGRAPVMPHEAVEVVLGEAGRLAPERLCRAFADLVAPYPAGALVRLSNGRGGRVVGCSTRLRPVVEVSWDARGEPCGPDLVDLAEHPRLLVTEISLVDEGGDGWARQG